MGWNITFSQRSFTQSRWVWFCILIPEAYGGSGLGYHEYIILLVKLRKGSVYWILYAHNSPMTKFCFGTEEQKQRWLPKFASGEWLALGPMSTTPDRMRRGQYYRQKRRWILGAQRNKKFYYPRTVWRLGSCHRPEWRKRRQSWDVCVCNRTWNPRT